MKRLDLVLLSLGLLALAATPAAADCRTVHRCAAPVVVQSPVAVVETIPVVPVVSAFLYPQVIAYGAAYTGAPFQQQGYAPQQPGYAQQPGQQDAVLAALQRLEQRLGAIEQRSGVAPQAPATPMPQADQPQEQQAAPAKQGQDNGGLAVLSAEKQREVLRRVYSTDAKVSMPRGKPALTDEELGVVVQWVATSGPPAPEVVKLFSTRCASCHQSGREGAGGNFVLSLK